MLRLHQLAIGFDNRGDQIVAGLGGGEPLVFVDRLRLIALGWLGHQLKPISLRNFWCSASSASVTGDDRLGSTFWINFSTSARVSAAPAFFSSPISAWRAIAAWLAWAMR